MSFFASVLGFIGKTIVPSVMAFFPYDIVLITPTPTPAPTPIVITTPTTSPTLTTIPTIEPLFTPTAKPTNPPTSRLSVTPTPSPSPKPSNTPTPTPTNPPSGGSLPTASQFDAWFTTYSQTYSVDRQKLWKIAVCESNFNPNATNGDYGGLYQFATQTWTSTRQQMQADPNPALRFNPEEAIRTGAYKLSVAGTAPWPACGK